MLNINNDEVENINELFFAKEVIWGGGGQNGQDNLREKKAFLLGGGGAPGV